VPGWVLGLGQVLELEPGLVPGQVLELGQVLALVPGPVLAPGLGSGPGSQ